MHTIESLLGQEIKPSGKGFVMVQPTIEIASAMPTQEQVAVMNRRRFLSASLASTFAGVGVAGIGLIGSILPKPAWAYQSTDNGNDFWLRPRTLRLRHPSGDFIEATFWSDGVYLRDGYEQLSWFLRDRTDKQGIYMDTVLLDILYGVQGWLRYFGVRDEMRANSGYRTPSRNRRIEGAALNSEHTRGKALDSTILGVGPQQVGKFGRWLGAGGVGFYPHRNFTHLDSGRVRTWRG